MQKQLFSILKHKKEMQVQAQFKQMFYVKLKQAETQESQGSYRHVRATCSGYF